MQQPPEEVLQQVSPQGVQQRRLHSRLSQPAFLQQQGEQQQGVQQVLHEQLGWQQFDWQLGWQHGVGQHGAGQGSHATGTWRQRLTHTSTGTQVLTRLQTVQGTHSVTV